MRRLPNSELASWWLENNRARGLVAALDLAIVTADRVFADYEVELVNARD